MMNKYKKLISYIRQGILFEHIERRITQAIRREKAFRKYKKIGELTPYIGVRDEASTYIVSTSDYSTGFKLFNQEPHLSRKTELLYEWCKRNLNCFNDSNKVLLNVGANIGCAVIPSIRKGYFNSAIAFEPEPLNYKLLEINIRLNNIQEHVRAYQIALSNESKEKIMYLSDHNLGAHSIMDEAPNIGELYGRDRENNLASEEIKVSCQTFDHFADTHNIKIDDIGLVLVDIEGHEGHFLEGAQKLLEKKIPLITEFCPPFLRRSKGTEKFLSNALQYYSHMVVNPFKRDPASFKLQDTKELESMIHSDKLFDLLLIP